MPLWACSLTLYNSMAQHTLSAPANCTDGAGFDLLSNHNALTIAAGVTGLTTLGGAAFVATAAAPSWVIGGSLMTAGLATGGHLKNTTGHYLPFLADKDVKVVASVSAPSAEVAPAAA